jgi:hypothetical protein
MARCIVNAGACGFITEVEVTQIDREHISVRVKTDCQNVIKLNEHLGRLRWRGREHVVFRPFTSCAIYLAGAECRLHTACPVPSAILRTIEAELGLAVRKNVSVTFLPDEAADTP